MTRTRPTRPTHARRGHRPPQLPPLDETVTLSLRNRCAALADRIKLAIDDAVPLDVNSFEVVGSLALIIAWTIAVHDHMTPEQKAVFRERVIRIINVEIDAAELLPDGTLAGTARP